jgi:hypothetical protein
MLRMRVTAAALVGLLASQDACGATTSNGPEAGGDAVLEADSMGDGGKSGGTHSPCAHGACGPNLVCEYPVAAGCSAEGVCVPFTPCGGAGKQPTYCGCDGGGVLGTCDVPGYVTGPVQSVFTVDGGATGCVPCHSGGPCRCADPSAVCGSLPVCAVDDAGVVSGAEGGSCQ